ncbi:hypothetical protein [Nesterenkonia populi]|uniref:hypothetical protein n=1 Tax=Nesterenkonia populi TaxID=1591087 RepID=UPI0011BE5B3D|nr:hypothetical protein [Nesterenkonia populi]
MHNEGRNPSPDTGLHTDARSNAVHRYVEQVLLPGNVEPNIWDPEDVVDHRRALVTDARKRRRITPTKVVTSYVFHSGGKQIGGIDGFYTTLGSAQARQAVASPEVHRGYLQAAGIKELADDDSAARAGDKLLVRFYVVAEQVVAAVVKLPFFVVGDGKQALVQLAEAEAERRSKCGYLRSVTPEVDETRVTADALTESTVLPHGQAQLLSGEISIKGGAVAADVLGLLDVDVRNLAVDAMWAFPGLAAAGVDILLPDIRSRENAQVLGVVPDADTTEFRYPAYGQYRRCSLAILDHMLDLAKR